MIGNMHRLLILIGILVLTQNVNAREISWGGYLNAIGAVSDSDTPYLNAEIDNRASFGDTSFGINLEVDLDEGLQLAAQLATHSGHTDIGLDWAFASYRLTDSSNLAVGQLKYPGNLVSEYVNVGYLYPWIRPPQEIYSHTEVSAAMTLESFRGVRYLYNSTVKNVEYDLQFYAGTAEEETMNHDKMVGLVATLYAGPVHVLLGYNRANMEMINIPTAPMNGKNMTVLSVGAMVDWQNIVAYSEFVRSATEDVPVLDTDGGYATLGYNFGKLLPHITYSFLDQDSGTGQTTWTLGMRRELSLISVLKLEWQRIKPNAPTAAGVAAVPMLAGVAGLFTAIPVEEEIDMLSVSVNILF